MQKIALIAALLFSPAAMAGNAWEDAASTAQNNARACCGENYLPAPSQDNRSDDNSMHLYRYQKPDGQTGMQYMERID